MLTYDCDILIPAALKNAVTLENVDKIKAKVILSDYYKWDGDAIEAHAFAYLSVRKLLNLPITFPKTTGVKKPLSGGRICRFF